MKFQNYFYNKINELIERFFKKNLNYISKVRQLAVSEYTEFTEEFCVQFTSKELAYLSHSGMNEGNKSLNYHKLFNQKKSYYGIIKNAKFYGNSGTVISYDGYILVESVSNYFRLMDSPAFRNIFLTKGLKFKKGLYTSIIHKPYTNNHYFHFVIECIPRLVMLANLNESINIIIEKDLPQFQKEILNIFVQQNSKFNICEINGNEKWNLEQFVLLSFPTEINSGYLPIPFLNFLKSGFIKGYALNKEIIRNRFYISRSKASKRRVSNERLIIPMLEKYNIKTVFLEEVNNLSKAKLFYNAELVIAPYGAGLSNIFLADENCHLIELSSKDNIRTHFMLLAKSAGIRFDFLLGTEMDEKEDFEISMSELEFKIQEFLKLCYSK